MTTESHDDDVKRIYDHIRWHYILDETTRIEEEWDAQDPAQRRPAADVLREILRVVTGTFEDGSEVDVVTPEVLRQAAISRLAFQVECLLELVEDEVHGVQAKGCPTAEGGAR